jgi:hypothetical protein
VRVWSKQLRAREEEFINHLCVRVGSGEIWAPHLQALAPLHWTTLARDLREERDGTRSAATVGDGTHSAATVAWELGQEREERRRGTPSR